MKAVILAGGKGTRLRPYSFVIPKPLMPIKQDPILLHLIQAFKKSGISDFLVSTGYQAELIRAYFGAGEKFESRIKYFHEDKPLGTAGPLALMRQELADDELFFLINGDIYTELDFGKMAEFARQKGCDVTVGCVERTEKSKFGVMELGNGEVKKIIEKPERTFSISAGIYVIRGRALKRIPEGSFMTMPDLIGSYLAKGEPVGAYQIREFWMGIEDLENMDEVIRRLEGQAQ